LVTIEAIALKPDNTYSWKPGRLSDKRNHDVNI
jgi:hypothetical protein